MFLVYLLFFLIKTQIFFFLSLFIYFYCDRHLVYYCIKEILFYWVINHVLKNKLINFKYSFKLLTFLLRTCLFLILIYSHATYSHTQKETKSGGKIALIQDTEVYYYSALKLNKL